MGIESMRDEDVVGKPSLSGSYQSHSLNYIIKISAENSSSLNKKIELYNKAIAECSDCKFEDFVYNLNSCEADFECRFAVTGGTKSEISERIEAYLAGDAPDGVFCNTDHNPPYLKDRKLVFMFTGQGSQYPGMGRLLFDTQEPFREAMLLCDRLFQPYISKSIIELIYGENPDEALIAKTIYAQPLIFSIEYALYKLWESYGVKPEIVMGHSIGEYPAAVAAGILALEDAVKLVSIRGRLMDSAPGNGAMATVFAEEEQVKSMLEGYGDQVSIAAINALNSCVISGNADTVAEILKNVKRERIRALRLKVSHAFHSKLMEPILGDFKTIADEVTYQKSKLRFVSSLYAREINDDEILKAEYWTNHIREKVDFYHAIKSISGPGDYVFLEVGAARVLSALFTMIFGEDGISICSLNMKKPDAKQIVESIAILYVSGVNQCK